MSFVHGRVLIHCLSVLFLVAVISWPVIGQELIVERVLPDAPLFSIISPLDNDGVSGDVLFIIKPSSPLSRSSIRLMDRSSDFVSSFSESESYTVSWPSLSVRDGEYSFEISACDDSRCETRELSVRVRNGLEDVSVSPDDSTVSPVSDDSIPSGSSSSPSSSRPDVRESNRSSSTISVTPSNHVGAFSLYRGSTQKNSTGDDFVIRPGSYSVDAHFLENALNVHVENVRLDSSNVLFFFENDVLDSFSIGKVKYSVSRSSSLSIPYSFGSASLDLAGEPLSYNWICLSWSRSREKCESEWVSPSSSLFTFDFVSSVVVLAHAAPVAVPTAPAGVPTPVSTVSPVVRPVVVSPGVVSPPVVSHDDVVSLSASNLPARAILFDGNGNEIRSSSGRFDVAKGVYDVGIFFIDSPIGFVFLENVRVDQNGVLLIADDSVDYSSISSPPDSNWLGIVSFDSEYSFSAGLVSIRPPESVSGYFECSSWDVREKKCSVSFEPVSSSDSMGDLSPLFSRFRESLPDSAQFSFVSLPLAYGWSVSPMNILLEQPLLSFAANDIPHMKATVSNYFIDSGDVPIVASLTFPDGSVHDLDSNAIVPLSSGEFDIFPFRPRNFVPGLYTITVKGKSNSESLVSSRPSVVSFSPPSSSPSSLSFASPPVSASRSFYWGLVAVNTMHSIYRPGETAEFEIVVLDKESFGVKGASVTLSITSPISGSSSVLSTPSGILETTTPGIYIAKLPVTEEGTYRVLVDALADGIDSSIQTTFDVHSRYDFDIVRWTATKIDPARLPVPVELTISPVSSTVKNVTVREFVPKEFDIVSDQNVWVYETANEKVIEWRSVALDSNAPAVLSYSYSVPDLKPWLYLLGPIEVSPISSIPSPRDSFWEARSWMVAVDENPTSKLFFRRTGFRTVAVEPSPNDVNCGVGCDIDSYLAGVQSLYNLSDINGTTTDTNAGVTGTTAGIKKYFSAVSWALVPQTIVTSGTWMAGIACITGSTLDNNTAPAFAIYRWIAETDSNGERIVSRFNASEMCPITTAAMRQNTKAGNVSSVTFNRGDKIVVEVLAAVNSTVPPPTSRTISYRFGNSSTPNDGNVILPSGVTLRFVGDANTMLVSPSNDSNKAINVPFVVDTNATCEPHLDNESSYFDCGDVNAVLQYCVLSSGQCGSFSDMNSDSSSPLYISSGSFVQSDDVLNMSDTNTFSFTVSGTQVGSYTLRSKVDGDWLLATKYSSGANDRNITIYVPPDINITKLDGYLDTGDFPVFNYFVDGNLMIDFNVLSVDRNSLLLDLNYSSSASPYTGTAVVDDVNLSLLPSSGSWYCDDTDFTDMTTCGIDWNISAVADGNYWIHATLSDSLNNIDIDVSDRNVGIGNFVPPDYSFVLFLPSSGCTLGKGNITGGVSCQKGYMESTDTTGVSDANQIAPEGQSASVPFFVYDNQSSTSSDLNIVLDLNTALSAELRLKASLSASGYESGCSGDTAVGCILLSTSTQNIGKAVYSVGSQDLNVWFWGDFVLASVGSSDVNVDSNSISP
ncbi:MAG: hypothetical protein V1776_00235 [Candidatus Diapherotrites archaeon]